MIELSFIVFVYSKAFSLANRSNFPDRKKTTNNNKHNKVCVFL